MDVINSMKTVLSRMHEIEPEHAFKIVGYLLLQTNGDQELIRLAASRDINVIKSIANQAKINLGLPDNPNPALQLNTNRTLPCHSRTRRHHSVSESPSNVCHPLTAESSSQYLGIGLINDNANGCQPRSLEKIEMELVEILRSRNGNTVSIASLSFMYYQRYGRFLWVEGYCTQSQQGKVGYSLSKLLATMKNTIRLIYRPFGQYSVILVDDGSEASHKIYLTFIAESTFTEKDLRDYFCKFGPVKHAGIPIQKDRMFGFVTFVYRDTVWEVLARGNPHIVSGCLVLVKPYKEKLAEEFPTSDFANSSHAYIDQTLRNVSSSDRESSDEALNLPDNPFSSFNG